MAVLGALAAGCSVVAVEVGAIPEMVRDGETGRLVPPAPAALRQAIADLVDAPALRRAMGDRARSLAASRSQARVVDQLLAVYREMIAAGTTAAQGAVCRAPQTAEVE